MPIQFMLGAFVASYIQNPKFRAEIDRAVQSLAGKGIDYVNQMEKPDERAD
jgi:hypothetical protein